MNIINNNNVQTSTQFNQILQLFNQLTNELDNNVNLNMKYNEELKLLIERKDSAFAEYKKHKESLPCLELEVELLKNEYKDILSILDNKNEKKLQEKQQQQENHELLTENETEIENVAEIDPNQQKMLEKQVLELKKLLQNDTETENFLLREIASVKLQYEDCKRAIQKNARTEITSNNVLHENKSFCRKTKQGPVIFRGSKKIRPKSKESTDDSDDFSSIDETVKTNKPKKKRKLFDPEDLTHLKNTFF